MTSALLALVVCGGQATAEPGYVQEWRATLLLDRLASSMSPDEFATTVRESKPIPFGSVPLGVLDGILNFVPQSSEIKMDDRDSKLFVQMNTRMYIREPETKGFYEVDLNNLRKLSASRMPIPSFPKEKTYRSEEGKLFLQAKHAGTHLVDLMLRSEALPTYLTTADFEAGQRPLADVDAQGIQWLTLLASQGKDLSPKHDLLDLLGNKERLSKATVEFAVQCVVNAVKDNSTSGHAFNLP